MNNTIFKPQLSYFNLSIFVFLIFVTIYGMAGGGGLQVIKVTILPIILSSFVVFGKKNQIEFTDSSMVIKRQFFGIFNFKDEVIELSAVKSLEVWSMFGARRITLNGSDGEIITYKAGEVVPERFDEIIELISKKTGLPLK